MDTTLIEGVGSTSPAALQARVLSEQADVGIAFDGDGDRVQCVAADGSVVDGDELAIGYREWIGCGVVRSSKGWWAH